MKSPSSAYITSFNDVTTDNLSTSATELLKKLQKGSHMAIDFEFTGMLKQKFQDMNHRYVGMKEAVERYSIVSFGLSVMKQTDQEEHVYECDNFEFLCRKNAQYVFEDGNIEFLTSTGFSFERLRAIGIPFTPPGDIGNEDYSSQNEKRDTRLIMLWKQILLALDVNKIPVIVHNGLYDIMYLYHSFIGKLPNTYSQFLSKLSDNFPAGFYDTKLLATESEFNATFLSYVFAKTDRLRQNRFTQNSGQYPYFEVTVNKPANSDTSDEAIETTTTMTIESVTESIETSTQEPTTSTSTDRKRKTEEITTVAISNSKKQKTTQKDICSHFAVSIHHHQGIQYIDSMYRKGVGVLTKTQITVF